MFDQECRSSKDVIKSIGKSIQSQPKDASLRQHLSTEKKKFRSLTRTKKRDYTKQIFNRMLEFDAQKESKKFWDSLQRLNNEHEVDFVSCISQDSWVNH